MKFTSLPRIKLTRLHLLSFFLLTTLTLSLTLVPQTGQAQQTQLSLADLLIGLRSKKVTLDERNKLLTDAVRQRGVTFALTPEIEKELGSTGASKELVEAIRQKSLRVKTPSIPATTPTPAPTSNPVAVKTPTPLPSPPPPDFAFYRKRADENIVKGEYDLALVDYNKAINLNSKDTSLYLNRGRAFYNKKDYDSAITDYNKAIELNPKDSTAYLNRAYSYERKGDTELAAADYQKVLELDGNNESAKNNLKKIRDEQLKNMPEPKKQETAALQPPAAAPQITDLGQLIPSLAVKMVTPVYSPIAKRLSLKGQVRVEVKLDEEGNVTSAKAVSGHQLLRSSAEEAALKSKFKPTLVSSRAVKATGFIIYNFIYDPSR